MNLLHRRIKKTDRPLRICLIPFWGEGNLGDEAMLTATLAHLCRKHPLAIFRAVAISRRGCYPIWRFFMAADKQQEQIRGIFSQTVLEKKGLFQKFSYLKSLILIFKNSDFIVFNGGLWFHDYKFYSMLLPLVISTSARLLGTRVVFLGISAGPIRSTWSKILGYLSLKLADQHSVRDQVSKNQLQQCWPRSPLHLGADPYFVIKSNRTDDKYTLLLNENFDLKKGNLHIGINIFPGFTFDNYYARYKQLSIFEQCLIKYCRYLVDDCRASLIFIPTQIPLDTDASLQLAKQCCRPEQIKVIQGHYPPEEYVRLIEGLDMMVAMRLHAHIFSIIAGTPFLSISYHSKISSLMQMIDADQFTIDSHNMNPKDLQMITQKILLSSGEIRDHLKKTRHHLREAALSNNHQLDMLLNNQPK